MLTTGGASNTESFKQLINSVNPTWFPGSVANIKSQRANDKVASSPTQGGLPPGYFAPNKLKQKRVMDV